MNDRKNETVIPITALLRDGSGKTTTFYDPTPIHAYSLNPLNLFGIKHTHNRIAIKESKINYTDGSSEDSICFTYSGKHSGEINILKTDVLKALNHPEKVQTDKLGVYLSKNVQFEKHSLMDSNPSNPLSKAYYIYNGNGWGSYNIALTFSSEKNLLGMQITKKYKAEEILFTSNNLLKKEVVREEYFPPAVDRIDKRFTF